MLRLGMATDPPSQGALGDIVDLITRVAAPGRQPVTGATELYYDLGLAGDDLYEVVADISARFGTDFTLMNLEDYAPGEAEALFSFDRLRELLVSGAQAPFEGQLTDLSLGGGLSSPRA